MKSIRCGSGLGDSLYLQSAVRHLVEKGESLEVCSNWPDVFRPIWDKIKLSPFRREVDIKAHYAIRKGETETNQFEDVCITAGIREPVDFRLDWTPLNTKLIERIKSPTIAVQLPRRPFDRKDGFGKELLPNCEVIQRAINLLKLRNVNTVLIGSGDALHHFSGIDLNLSNRTSVSDLIDVAYAVDGFLGYVSFIVPLAESLSKPALLVWSKRGLQSSTEFLSRITPRKILHRATSRHAIDDCSEDDLAAAVDTLLAEIGHPGLYGQDGGDRRLWAGGAR